MSDKSSSQEEFPFLGVFLLLSILASLIVGSMIAKEREKLNDIQNNQLDSRGLPRAKGTHPGLQNLARHCIVLALVLVGVFFYGLLSRWISEGHPNEFPGSLLVPIFHTYGLVVLSFGYPLMTLACKLKIGRSYARDLLVPIDELRMEVMGRIAGRWSYFRGRIQ